MTIAPLSATATYQGSLPDSKQQNSATARGDGEAAFHAIIKVNMGVTEPYTQAPLRENFSNVQKQKAPFYAIYVPHHGAKYEQYYDFSELLTAVVYNSAGDVEHTSTIKDVYNRATNDVRDTHNIYLATTHSLDQQLKKLVTPPPIPNKTNPGKHKFNNINEYFHFNLLSKEELNKYYPVFENLLHHRLIVDPDESSFKEQEREQFCQFLCIAAKILHLKSKQLDDKQQAAALEKKVLYLQKSAMALSKKVRGWFGQQCRKDRTSCELKIENLRKQIKNLEVDAMPAAKKHRHNRRFRPYSLRSSTGSLEL